MVVMEGEAVKVMDAAAKPQAINQLLLILDAARRVLWPRVKEEKSAISCCLSVPTSKLITQMHISLRPRALSAFSQCSVWTERQAGHTGWSWIMRPASDQEPIQPNLDINKNRTAAVTGNEPSVGSQSILPSPLSYETVICNVVPFMHYGSWFESSSNFHSLSSLQQHTLWTTALLPLKWPDRGLFYYSSVT